MLFRVKVNTASGGWDLAKYQINECSLIVTNCNIMVFKRVSYHRELYTSVIYISREKAVLWKTRSMYNRKFLSFHRRLTYVSSGSVFIEIFSVITMKINMYIKIQHESFIPSQVVYSCARLI